MQKSVAHGIRVTAVSAIRVHALTQGLWPLSLLTLALALVPMVVNLVSALIESLIHLHVLVLTPL